MSMLSTYDAWKTASPTDDLPSVRDDAETCEHCGADVAPCDPAFCTTCHKYSDRARRPERDEEASQ